MADMGPDAKLGIYTLVLGRYKDLISEKESRSISEIRQRVSPYNDFIRKMRDSFTSDMVHYVFGNQFFVAAERAMSYVRDIRTCEFAFTFWMEFKEMDELKFGTSMDKAILLAALLRSLESTDARVLVTRKRNAFVRFSWAGANYLFAAENGSLLAGDDALKVFADDPVAYSFNDLAYENYEEND
jgi:hypothetical protein